MSGRLFRVSAGAALSHAEELRALALELAPGGFEESETTDTLTVSLYVEEGEVDRVLRAFPAAEIAPVATGWEDGWRTFHRPARVGGLWIGPPWEQPDPGVPAVVIDPGRAFGTGAHPTTRLCIELLARCGRGSLLDVGCGSGVLSIAASRLGFAPICSVDNDPVAVETTVANAALNDVVLDAILLDGESDELPCADVAVANVLLAPVEMILARLDVGEVVASGYLTADHPVAPGWRLVERLGLDGWAADRFARAP